MRLEMLKRVVCVSFLVIISGGLEAKETQLTIYNQNFAVVKENRNFELTKGENELRVTDITAYLDPESVILRDLEDPNSLRILEQNYESDPLSESFLLRKAEGKTLDFEVTNPKTGEKEIIKAKIIRSGYIPRSYYNIYSPQYYQQGYQQQQAQQPIVEVNGKIHFGLPGRPIFDSLEPGSFLKPTLLWKLWTVKAGKRNVEFSYITNEMSWIASYNLIMPEKGDKFDCIGWITINNSTDKEFEKASVKLIAGDVAKLQPQQRMDGARKMAYSGTVQEQAVAVTERAFEEYHLYTLPRQVTILDKEIKQIEFIHANEVPFQRFYVYDGFRIDEQYRHWDYYSIRERADYGTQCNKKVWVMLEFKNSEKNYLGIPLPKGKMKIYRRDIDGRNEFIGEDQIDHTPKDEMVRVYMGNAFDIVGERKQTNFKIGNITGRTDVNRYIDESFEIKLRNHKKKDISVKVIEHLYRWYNWEIKDESSLYLKKDSKTIEFLVNVPSNGEKVITYSVHYTW